MLGNVAACVGTQECMEAVLTVSLAAVLQEAAYPSDNCGALHKHEDSFSCACTGGSMKPLQSCTIFSQLLQMATEFCL